MPSSSNHRRIALTALTLAALALRLVHLTRFELWVDEAATWHFAKLAVAGGILEQARLEPTPPLFYALVGVLMRLFGESDLVMRLPSTIFGALAVPLAFELGRRLWNRRAGWVGAVVMAVHPLHVFYSREARVYPLLLALTLLLFLLLWRALETDRTRLWIAFAAVLTLACFSHFLGLFLGATAGILILGWGRDTRTRLRGLAAAAVAGLLFAPYLLYTATHLGESGAAWSVERMYEVLPGERRLGRSLEMSMLGAHYSPFVRQVARPPTPPVLRLAALGVQGFLLVLAVVAALAARRRSRDDDDPPDALHRLAFLLVAWVGLILLPWVVSHVHTFFQTGRHDVYALGMFAVLLGVGGDGLLRRARENRGWRMAVVLVGVVLVAAVGQRLLALHLVPAGERHRPTGERIARHAEPGDQVIATGIRRLVTEHYARLAGSDVPFTSFPRSTDDHPGWSDVRTLLEDEPALAADGRERVAELARDLPPGATLFVLLGNYERSAAGVSADWHVDRHLVEPLAAAGWQRVAELEDRELAVAALRPPPRPSSPSPPRASPRDEGSR